jgi:carbon storage regulator
MLILSRKVGERVLIGEGIVVQVLEVYGRRVRLGIEAPGDITIRREELPVVLETPSACPGAPRKPR